MRLKNVALWVSLPLFLFLALRFWGLVRDECRMALEVAQQCDAQAEVESSRDAENTLRSIQESAELSMEMAHASSKEERDMVRSRMANQLLTNDQYKLEHAGRERSLRLASKLARLYANDWRARVRMSVKRTWRWVVGEQSETQAEYVAFWQSIYCRQSGVCE